MPAEPREPDSLTLLTTSQVLALVPISARALESYISAGKFPPPDIRPSKRLRLWRRQTIERWITGGGVVAEAGRE